MVKQWLNVQMNVDDVVISDDYDLDDDVVHIFDGLVTLTMMSYTWPSSTCSSMSARARTWIETTWDNGRVSDDDKTTTGAKMLDDK